jgi:hypothetical protein
MTKKRKKTKGKPKTHKLTLHLEIEHTSCQTDLESLLVLAVHQAVQNKILSPESQDEIKSLSFWTTKK